MNKTFPLESSIKFGFNKFIEHLVTLLLAALGMACAYGFAVVITIATIVSLIVGLISGTLLTGMAFPFILIGIVLAIALPFAPMIFSMGVTRGFIRILLDIYQSNASTVSRLFSEISIKKSLQFLVLIFTLALIVIVGFVLLFIPGVIFLARFFYAPYVMVDRNTGIIDSLRISWNITSGVTLMSLLFIIVVGLINVIPLVGTIISLLASVYAYKELAKQDIQPAFIHDQHKA